MSEIMELADKDLKTVNINMFKDLKQQLPNFSPGAKFSPPPVLQIKFQRMQPCIFIYISSLSNSVL